MPASVDAVSEPEIVAVVRCPLVAESRQARIFSSNSTNSRICSMNQGLMCVRA